MELERIKNKVELQINELINEFKRNPDKFLTEEDVRAYLYHLLLKNFNSLEKTKDGGDSIPLHTEVRWYGKDLKFRSDIVLFDVSTLKTKDKDGFRLSSKGYNFDTPYILIETKLRRKDKGSDNKFKVKILADRDKIKRIREQIEISEVPFYSYIIVLDKQKDIQFKCNNTDYDKEFYVPLNNN
jgi:hypothetical protein